MDTKLRGLLLIMALLLGCGAQPQAPSCRAFVGCVQALDRVRNTTTNLKRFEPGGDCWVGEAGARLCGDACARGLEVFRASDGAALAECAP